MKMMLFISLMAMVLVTRGQNVNTTESFTTTGGDDGTTGAGNSTVQTSMGG